MKKVQPSIPGKSTHCHRILFTSPSTPFLCIAAAAVALVMSDSERPHRRQPTRLLHPWDFLGKSTGVGCHCLLPFYALLLLKHLMAIRGVLYFHTHCEIICSSSVIIFKCLIFTEESQWLPELLLAIPSHTLHNIMCTKPAFERIIVSRFSFNSNRIS